MLNKCSRMPSDGWAFFFFKIPLAPHLQTMKDTDDLLCGGRVQATGCEECTCRACQRRYIQGPEHQVIIYYNSHPSADAHTDQLGETVSSPFDLHGAPILCSVCLYVES